MALSVRRTLRGLGLALVLAGIAATEILLPPQPAIRLVGAAAALLLAASFVRESLRRIRRAARVRAVLRTRFIELGLTAAALALLGSGLFVWISEMAAPETGPELDSVYRQYLVAFLTVAALRAVAGDFTVRRMLHRLELRPAQTVAASFAAAILVGGVLLSLPVSVERLEQLSLVNTLFTATSALTTTGLVVYDPGTFHTRFGQVMLLLLVQLGGLGTMAASATLVVLAGRRFRLRTTAALQETMDLATPGQVRSQVKTIAATLLVTELVGAAALTLAWRGRVEAPAFHALFHAVSAVCTAGFSTFQASLEGFRSDAWTNLVVTAMVLVGSLGFPVVTAGRHWLRRRRGLPAEPPWTLHVRLALLTTGIVLVGGFLAIAALEWRGALAPLAWRTRLVTAAFLSATAHSTAGFSTVDTGTLAPATLAVLMAVMFIGGGPGSTAGGIKTTTLAVVVATFWATLRGAPRVEAFRRTIPEEQVAKALALGGISSAVVAVAAVLLLASQTGPPLGLIFEVVSSFGTVGLSAGATPTLNAWGKTIIMAVMFAGRTGPLTLGFALALHARPSAVTYPDEKVMIG